MPAPAHPPPELVELGEAEALGVLHHHEGGVGHVHAHLNDRRRDQNVHIPGGEGGHHRVLLLRLHPAVDESHPQVGKDFGLQLLRIGGDGLEIRVGSFSSRFAPAPFISGTGDLGRLALLHGGADDIGLTALAHQLADEIVHPLPLVLTHDKGVHRGAARGQLVDHREVQVSVDDEGQGPGDGGGGHDQDMGGDLPGFRR